EPGGELLLVALGVVRLEPETDGDASAKLPAQGFDLAHVVVELVLAHRELRVPLCLRQEVEGHVVRESDLGEPALDRAEHEVARGAAGMAAPEGVDVVIREAGHARGRLHRPDYQGFPGFTRSSHPAV